MDAFEFSHYATRARHADPGLPAQIAIWLAQAITPSRLAARLEALDPVAGRSAESLGCALRRLRREVFVAVMHADLAGRRDQAALWQVTYAMSDLAEVALDAALAQSARDLAETFGLPRDANGAQLALHVVGMGKLGGRELNVSSDIDLIFIYPEDGETDGGPDHSLRRISAHDWFTRQGKALIRLISDVTGDGYVFRVDMRLRPNGDSGPLVASFAMLEEYLVTQGREWERYAWIKGRTLTGDQPDALAAVVRPFVFRRYLDYGAVDALRGLHAIIRKEVARRDLADHIKLGPGGIREIEFIAQAFQLIRGGRDTALQVMPTLTVLQLLGERSQLDAPAVGDLTQAYVFLRHLEHRLQYLDDQQTHTLPASAESQARVAAAMGGADYPALLAQLNLHRSAVTRHFEAVFNDRDDFKATSTGASEAESTTPDLYSAFTAPADIQRRYEAFTAGARFRSLAEATQRRAEALLPRLLLAAAQCGPERDFAAVRSLDFIEAIAPRSAYLALLLDQRQALARLVQLLGASSWAAQYLTLHPILLDELIDPRSLSAQPDVNGLANELARALLHHQGDLERQLNVVRELHHAFTFRLLAADLSGNLSVEHLADHLSAAADAVVATVLSQLWRELPGAHREAAQVAVIAYGKWGGKELGYASDLDLVLVHHDTHEKAPLLYARLAQKLISFLETRTIAGTLFETDTRLRPDGVAGPMVASFAALTEYQHTRAWVWEHQALTRARFAAGDTALGARFEQLREAVLCAPRERAKLRAEVREMRRKMHDGHPNKTALFDLKHDTGGMVDIEFAVQTLVLAHAAEQPALVANLGNIALLQRAAQCGLLNAEIAASCGNAYRRYRQLQHAQRLNSADGATAARVAGELVSVERAAVDRLWMAVFWG